MRGWAGSATPSCDHAWLLLASGTNGRAIHAVDVTAGGRVLRTTRLLDMSTSSRDLASARDGTAAFAWVTRDGLRVRVRVRRPGARRFEPPITLTEERPLGFADHPTANGLAVVVRPRGGVAVFWAVRNAVHLRIRRPGARRFDAAKRVGPASTATWTVPVYSADGRLSVIWHSHDAGEEQNRPARLHVAVLRPGRQQFERSRVPGVGAWIEQRMMGGSVASAAAAGDRVLVSYTLADRGLHVAELTRRGRLADVQTVDAHGVLGALVGARTGTAVLSWMHRPQSFPAAGLFPVDSQIYAAVRAPGLASFGAGEAVAPVGTTGGAAALDPAGTMAVISWGTVDPAAPPLTGMSMRAGR